MSCTYKLQNKTLNYMVVKDSEQPSSRLVHQESISLVLPAGRMLPL
jgi:hypothetical protein